MEQVYILCKPEQRDTIANLTTSIASRMDVAVTIVTDTKDVPCEAIEVPFCNIREDEKFDNEKIIDALCKKKEVDAEKLAEAIEHIQQRLEQRSVDTYEFVIPEPEVGPIMSSYEERKYKQQKFNKDQQAKARRYFNKHYRK